MMDFRAPERLEQALKAQARLARASTPGQESVVGRGEVEAVKEYLSRKLPRHVDTGKRDFQATVGLGK